MCLICAFVTPRSLAQPHIVSIYRHAFSSESAENAQHNMASGTRIQCWLLFLAFVCLVGSMEAIKKAPRRALLLDSRQQDANRQGTSTQGLGVVESQSVLTEEDEMVEEGRILLADGNNTSNYPSPYDYPRQGCNCDHYGCNRDRYRKGQCPQGNGKKTETNN